MQTQFTTRCAVLAAVLVWAAAATVQAGTAEDLYAAAAGHYAAGRWQRSVEGFATFLERYPSHNQALSARFHQAEALVQLARYEQAGGAFSRLLQEDPAGPFAGRALYRAGELAYLTGRREDGYRLLTEFHSRFADDALNARVVVYLGDICLARDEWAEARRWYELAQQRYPDGPLSDHVALELGRILTRAGEPEAAEQVLSQLVRQTATGERRTEARFGLILALMAQQRWEEAAQMAREAAADDARHPLAAACAYHGSEALRRAGKLEEAEAQFERVRQSWPTGPWADDTAHGQLLVALARHDHERVDQLSAQFVQRYPDSPLRQDVIRGQVRSLLERGRYGDAATRIEPLVSSAQVDAGDPSGQAASGWNRYLLGLAILGERRHEDAVAVLAPIFQGTDQAELLQGARAALASAYLGAQEYARALEQLEAYLRAEPNGAEAVRCRAQQSVALARLGRWTDAQEAFAGLTQLGPDPGTLTAVTQVLAESAYAAGDYAAAQKLFEALAATRNDDHVAARGLLGVAWCQVKTSQFAKATAGFNALLEQYPDDPLSPETALACGRVWEQLAQPDKALAMYQLVVERYPDSAHLPQGLLDVARLYDSGGRAAQALPLIERIVTEHPHAPQVEPALYLWGWVLRGQGRTDESVSVFDRLYREHRDGDYWSDATFRLAEHARQANDYDRAARLLDEIIAAARDRVVLPHALYLRGQTAAATRRWDAVSEPLERLLEDYPDSPLCPAARFWIAESHYHRGQYEEAATWLAQLRGEQVAGHDGASWLAMVPLREGQMLAARKQWTAAAEAVRGLEARFPDFPRLYEADYLLGRCAAAEGEFDKARACYARVIASPAAAQSETAAMAQWMIGETYFHQKRYDEAIAAYLAVEADHEFPRWRAAGCLQAGKCHQLQGNPDEARACFGRVAQQYPDTPYAKDAIRLLNLGRPSTP